MKLALSNLAFPDQLDAARCKALFDAGVRGVEVAPTRLGDWTTLTESRLRDFRSLLNDHGLSISSLQAILFNVPNAHLLKGDAEFQTMAEHMELVSGIASTLGAKVMVFGAPKQRTRGDLEEAAAFQLGRERLGRLVDICSAHDVTIGLEPVPAAYGGDFLPTWQSVKQMIEAVPNKHFAVHLDTACVALGGGDIGEAIVSSAHVLGHFHISEPNLTDFATPSDNHTEAAAVLRRVGYSGWVAIEMLGKGETAWDAALDAVAFARRCYNPVT